MYLYKSESALHMFRKPSHDWMPLETEEVFGIVWQGLVGTFVGRSGCLRLHFDVSEDKEADSWESLSLAGPIRFEGPFERPP